MYSQVKVREFSFDGLKIVMFQSIRLQKSVKFKGKLLAASSNRGVKVADWRESRETEKKVHQV